MWKIGTSSTWQRRSFARSSGLKGVRGSKSSRCTKFTAIAAIANFVEQDRLAVQHAAHDIANPNGNRWVELKRKARYLLDIQGSHGTLLVDEDMHPDDDATGVSSAIRADVYQHADPRVVACWLPRGMRTEHVEQLLGCGGFVHSAREAGHAGVDGRLGLACVTPGVV